MHPVDFSRNVVCIMGLPFDDVDMGEAVARIRAAVKHRVPFLVSTANLNFAVTASEDEAFRDSVIHSQLCLADGMPIVWIARLLGLPVRERVSGASLFEALSQPADPAVKVFFFGGAEGVAQVACERVNLQQGGLRCVGYEAPGFASVESMSDDDCIERINRAAADFIVVSLGAKKGHAWIERNRARLNAPVVSHLGAVVNFAAGTVLRAPAWMQRVGLEWLWRMKEEPGLWRRYAGDAAALTRIVIVGVIPLWWQHLWPRRSLAVPTVDMVVQGSVATLKLAGGGGSNDANIFRDAFAKAALAMVDRIRVDLTLVEKIDASVIGMLLLLRAHQRGAGRSVELLGASKSLTRQFRRHGVMFLLSN